MLSLMLDCLCCVVFVLCCVVLCCVCVVRVRVRVLCACSPTSWRDPSGASIKSRTVDQAVSTLEGYRQQIVDGADFAELAKVRGHTHSRQRTHDRTATSSTRTRKHIQHMTNTTAHTAGSTDLSSYSHVSCIPCPCLFIHVCTAIQ